MKTKVSLISEAGGRSYNEDYCCYQEQGDHNCYLLADGLGGHEGGALASQTLGDAVIKAHNAFPGLTDLHFKNYLDQACLAFNEIKNRDYKNSGMKATLVLLLFDKGVARWGHIGDSRLYYFKGGQIIHRTKDHSVPQLLADSGEIEYDQIRFHEDRNRLTAAFDGEKMAKFKILEEPHLLSAGDVFLLCSDGFWEYIDESSMEHYLSQTDNPEKWLKSMENKLVEIAEPGHDNYSALAVMID